MAHGDFTDYRVWFATAHMDTVRPRCTRVKPGKGAHSGNYYKLPQIGRMGAIEELS
jgi:hypothetical protein